MIGIDDGKHSNKKLIKYFQTINNTFYKLLSDKLIKNNSECDYTADLFFSEFINIPIYNIKNNVKSNIINFNEIDDNKNYILRIKIMNNGTNLPGHSIVLVLHNNKAYLIQSYIDLYEQCISVYPRNTIINDFKSMNTKKFMKYFINYPIRFNYKLNYIIKKTINFINSFKTTYNSYSFHKLLKNFYEIVQPEKATNENISNIIKKFKPDILIDKLEYKYERNFPTKEQYNNDLEHINSLEKDEHITILEKLIDFLQEYFNSEPNKILNELQKWKQFILINEQVKKTKSIDFMNIYVNDKYYQI